MITISTHSEIHDVLCKLDRAATVAINDGKKLTVEWRDDGITKSQFSALHVWCRQCSAYLNSINMYRLSPVSGKRVPWTEIAFKEDVYKPVLAALTDKTSTKNQNTVEPDQIRLAITGHMATAYRENIQLPEWPYLR